MPLHAVERPLSYSKEDMIQYADFHKKMAFKELAEADRICVFIPNMESKDHIIDLISLQRYQSTCWLYECTYLECRVFCALFVP